MPKNVEIERKFLVTTNDYKSKAIGKHEIMQGYLCKDKNRTIRIRIKDDKAFITIKSALNTSNIARFEWEHEIDIADARQLMSLCLPDIIEKTRWIVPANDENGAIWEIDEFLGRLYGLVVAEIELKDEQQIFSKPDFIGEEVTGDPRYYNANM